jgi:hypothetical protein
MADRIQFKEIAAQGIHVRDCCVRAEIHYLDSPSDYREYLPQDQYWTPVDDRLVMLHSRGDCVSATRDRWGLVAAIFFLIVGFIGLLLLYLVSYSSVSNASLTT